MTSGPRAVTVGSATVDIITLIADEDVERITLANATTSFLMLEQGRKIDAEDITIHCGGGAVNVAVSLARLGFQASVLSKVGDDLNAGKVRETLHQDGVSDTLLITTGEMATGVAVMISSHDRNATIFTRRGANTLLQSAEIESQDFDGLDLLYVASLSGTSAECFPLLLERGRKAGAMVASNPGIRQLTLRRDEFCAALENVDLLSMNRVESEALLPGMTSARPGNQPLEPRPEGPALMERGLHFEGLQLELDNFVRELHERGPRYVVITDGIEGSYLSSPQGLFYCPILKTEVAGTAGAGDSFTSTLAGMLATGMTPDEALRAATVNASSVVSHVDTQAGLLGRKEIQERVRAHRANLAVRKLD